MSNVPQALGYSWKWFHNIIVLTKVHQLRDLKYILGEMQYAEDTHTHTQNEINGGGRKAHYIELKYFDCHCGSACKLIVFLG